MGFLRPDEPEAPEPPPRKAGRAPKADKGFDSGVRGCEACALRETWNSIASPRMALSGNIRDPEILVLGGAPGEAEDRDGVAFVGASDRLLRKAIPGRELERVAFQNTVRCRPFGDAAPSAREAHACSIHLEGDIARLPIKAILGVGGVPLSHFFRGANITRIHGTRFAVQIGAKTLWYWPSIDPALVIRTGGDRSSAYGIFKSDIKRFFSQVDKWEAPQIWTPDPADVLLPQTEEEAEELLAAMEGKLGVDLETTGLRFAVKDAKILTAAISDGELTMAFAVDHPEAPTSWGMRFLLKVIQTRQWIAHNACFELVWLLHARNQANLTFEPANYDDSMALGRIYHQRATLLGLDTMTRIHLGCDFKAVVRVNRSNMINEPLERILPYNGLDALASVLLYKKLRSRLRGDDETNYLRLLQSIRSTAEMELLGLPIDIDATQNLKYEWESKLFVAQQQARLIYEVRQFEREKQVEFNLGSGKDVGIALVEYGQVILPKTNKGKGELWSTDDQDLRAAAPDNPLVKTVIAYREAQKIVSTYILPVLEAHENNFDQQLHPAYTCMLTATGRPSSEAPNIQNFPKRRHRAIRRSVRAPDGHVFCSFDYGQIEARGFCFATADPTLCADTIRKEDIHGRWRDRALELAPDYIERLAEMTNETEHKAVLKGGRDIIKTDFVFASFFGSDARAIARRTNLPLAVTEQLLAEFWARYPKVLAWVKARRREYADTGDIRTLTGMVRHEIVWGNEPLNNPIQGTTTGHMVLEAQNAMAAIARQTGDMYFHPRINIHDDLTFVLPNDTDVLETYIDIIAHELVAVRFDFQIVPLMVEAKIGTHWDELEEIATFVGPYLR